MKKATVFSSTLIIGLSILLGSCSRDNSVVSSSVLQKRKYQSGFHFESNKKIKSIQQNELKEKNEVAVVVEKVENNLYHTVETDIKTNEEFNEIMASTNDDLSLVVVNKEKPELITAASSAALTTTSSLSLEKGGEVFSKRSTKELKKILRNEKKAEKNSNENEAKRIDSIVYILLCIFLPPVAVGLATNWDVAMTLISLLLTILFWLPGIIFAFYICDREGVI